MRNSLYDKPEGCMLSRIVGRIITHKVMMHDDFSMKIVSAGGNRQGGLPLYHGTYSQCEQFVKYKRTFYEQR